MAFSNESQFEKILMKAEEQNRWQVFEEEVYNVITEGCNYLDIICFLLRTDLQIKEVGFLESPEA